MKSFLARQTDLLAAASVMALGTGIGFLVVATTLRPYPGSAKVSWDTGTTVLVGGLLLGCGACKASQYRRELNG
jgi:hypothetical protein